MEDLTRRHGNIQYEQHRQHLDRNGRNAIALLRAPTTVGAQTNERAGVDAHYGAAKTYDYFQSVHGRNGIDGVNGPGTTTAAANSGISLVIFTRTFRQQLQQRFLVPEQNDLRRRQRHKLHAARHIGYLRPRNDPRRHRTHCNLTYANESGALNESMSDVFGAMVELYADGGTISSNTWKIGEDAYTPEHCGRCLALHGQSARSRQRRLYIGRRPRPLRRTVHRDRRQRRRSHQFRHRQQGVLSGGCRRHTSPQRRHRDWYGNDRRGEDMVSRFNRIYDVEHEFCRCTDGNS